jgi:hypothetical protein
LRLHWPDLAKAVLLSTIIMAMEWKQAALIMGLIQMLGVSLLILIDPRARRAPHHHPKPELKIEVKLGEGTDNIEEQPELKIDEPKIEKNLERIEKPEHHIGIPNGKIFLAALSIPTLIIVLAGGLNEDSIQIALLASMGISLFLGLLAFVLSLLREGRASAIAGATGALLFYSAYYYVYFSGMMR